MLHVSRLTRQPWRKSMATRRCLCRMGTVGTLRLMRIPPWLPLLAVFAAALVASFPPPQHPDQPVKLFPDSVTYLNWTHGRPPTPSLFYAVVRSGTAICIAQTVISVLSWTAFGWMALGLLGALFAAALGASLPVALWNYTVLSEPLALSLGAALCAATLALGRRWSWPRFAAWAACTALFTGVRVENFFIVPLFCAPLMLWHRARWLPLGAAGAVSAVMFIVFGILLDKETANWQTRMTNVVLTRILMDPHLMLEFQARGLPNDPVMIANGGRLLRYYDNEFRAQSPQFQRWLEEESRGTYLRWLATLEPHRLLIASMDNVNSRITNGYYMGGVVYPRAATSLVRMYDAMAMPFRYWYWLAVVPVLCAAVTRRIRFVDLFALAYLAAVYVMAFVVFHADTGELDRHMSLVAALYRMAPVVVLACVWDRVAERVQAWRQPCPEPQTV
jgi:hypothetical protein